MLRSACPSLILGLTWILCPAQDTPTQTADPKTVASSAPNPLGDALASYRKGNFEDAIAKYEDYATERPHSPDAYAGLVRVYLKQKNVAEAARAVQRGLAQTNAPRMHVAQGELWFREGRIDEAEAEWAKVINSGSREARAYLGLARVREAIAMYKSAKTMLDKAHELDPGDPDIREEWMGTLSRGERIKYLEAALAGENNRDTDERNNVANYLTFMKERPKQSRTPCHLVSTVKATETNLVRLLEDPQHGRGYGVAISINGHKSSLMLDTGASGILVRRAIAEHAGVSKISETTVWGVGKKGPRNAYVGIADSIKIGNLEFQNCPVEVMESRSVAGEEGLIGADVFEHFLVDIDFPKEKLKLSELPKRPGEAEQQLALTNEDEDDDDSDTGNSKTAESKRTTGPQDRYIAPEMANFTRVFRFGHNLLVPTAIGKVPKKLFLLDTGAFTNFISPAAAREVTKVRQDPDTIIKVISGQVDAVYSASNITLEFGNLWLEHQDITAFDTKSISDAAGTEISGFLGFAMLNMLDIKIDYRDALVGFSFDWIPIKR